MTTDAVDYPAPTMSADEIPLAYSLVALHSWVHLIPEPSMRLMAEARRESVTLGSWWASTEDAAEMLWLAEQGGDVPPEAWMLRTFVVPALVRLAGHLDHARVPHGAWKLVYLCQKAESKAAIKEIAAAGAPVFATGSGLGDIEEWAYMGHLARDTNDMIHWIIQDNTPAQIVAWVVRHNGRIITEAGNTSKEAADAVRALWPTPPAGIVAMMRRVNSYQYITGNGLPNDSSPDEVK